MKGLAIVVLLVVSAMGVSVADRPSIRRPPLARSPADPALAVVLVLDVSASVSRLPLLVEPRFAQVFNAFLRGLKSGDRASISLVERRVRSAKLTSDPQELSSIARLLLQVPDAERLGPSPIWDALDESVTLLAGETGRLAIVLFSDGKSSGNIHGVEEVAAHARQMGVSISAVVEGDSSPGVMQRVDGLDPADLIESLVKATGGRVLLDRPPNPRDRNPAPMITQIMDALHQGKEPF